MRLAVVLVTGWVSLATTIAVGGEVQAPKPPLAFKLKPDNTYRYDFELRSGEDGDGFLQLDGSVSYTPVASAQRPSLIDDAFKNGDDEGKVVGKPIALRVHGVVNGKKAPSQFVDGSIRISPRGDNFKLQENDYSMLSTTVGSLAFDELPPAKQTKWESTRTRKIVFVDEEVVGFPQRFSMLRYGRYSQLRPEAVQLQRATLNQMNVEEKASYELVELTEEKAVVKTRLASSWVSGASGKKAVDLETSGQYTFDRGRNVIAKGHSQSELRVTSEGIEAKLPFKMAFVLQEVLTAEEMKERAAKLESDQKEAEATRLKESEQRVSKAIATLKDPSSKPTDVRNALTTLSIARRNASKPERKEVATLLNKFLKSDDETTRMAAVRAAQDWATTENIPALLELLKTTESFQRGTIIQALGATGGNADVATVLVRLMESPNTRFFASQALQKMGPVGEPAVLPLLKSTERSTRDDACQILGEIGGKKSKAALEAIMAKTKEGDFQNIHAKMALDKINERLAADLN